ncbi:Protein TASOR, partial [Frankliniella fusca]
MVHTVLQKTRCSRKRTQLATTLKKTPEISPVFNFSQPHRPAPLWNRLFASSSMAPTVFHENGPNSRLHCKKHPKLVQISTFLH